MHPRPKIFCSRCLEFAATRYNGQMIHNDLVAKLRRLAEFVTACPEVEVGLGVPRRPVRIVAKGSSRRLIQLETERDVTAEMEDFAETLLNGLGPIDGFIMKSRSPSCGIKSVKYYPSLEKVASHARGSGIFGAKILEMFAGLPIEDEGRLGNQRIREHFLTRLYAFARFREAAEIGRIGELIRFHSIHKYLLMGYNQKELHILGRIVANPDKRRVADLFSDYRQHLSPALQRSPRVNSIVNVLMHVFGYFSKQLSDSERSYFLDLLRKYRDGHVTLNTIQLILKAWIIRFEIEYLKDQVFFDPYPEDLLDDENGHKKRDYDLDATPSS